MTASNDGSHASKGEKNKTSEASLMESMERTKENIFLSLEEQQLLVPHSFAKRQEISSAIRTILYNFSEEVIEAIDEFDDKQQQQQQGSNNRGQGNENALLTLVNDNHSPSPVPIDMPKTRSETGLFRAIKPPTISETIKLREQLKNFQDLSHYFEEKLKEKEDVLQKTNIQMDFLKGQLLRRDQELSRMRERYYKDVFILREQLYRKEKGADYDDYHMPLYEPSADDSSGDNNADKISQKYQKALKDLTNKFREEKRLMELEYEEEIRRLKQQLEDHRNEFENISKSGTGWDNEIKELKKEISLLQLEKTQSDTDIQNYQKQLSESEDLIMQLREEVSSKVQQHLEVSKELEIAKNERMFVEFDGKKYSIDEVETELENAKKIEKRFAAKEKNILNKITRCQMENEDLKARFHFLTSYNDSMELQIGEMQKEITNQKTKMHAHVLSEIQEQHERNLIEKNEKIINIQKSKEDVEKKLQTETQKYEKQIEEARQVEIELRQKLTQKEAERSKSEAKYKELQARYNELKAREKQLEKILEKNSKTKQSESQTFYVKNETPTGEKLFEPATPENLKSSKFSKPPKSPSSKKSNISSIQSTEIERLTPDMEHKKEDLKSPRSVTTDLLSISPEIQSPSPDISTKGKSEVLNVETNSEGRKSSEIGEIQNHKENVDISNNIMFKEGILNSIEVEKKSKQPPKPLNEQEVKKLSVFKRLVARQDILKEKMRKKRKEYIEQRKEHLEKVFGSRRTILNSPDSMVEERKKSPPSYWTELQQSLSSEFESRKKRIEHAKRNMKSIVPPLPNLPRGEDKFKRLHHSFQSGYYSNRNNAPNLTSLLSPKSQGSLTTRSSSSSSNNGFNSSRLFTDARLPKPPSATPSVDSGTHPQTPNALGFVRISTSSRRNYKLRSAPETSRQGLNTDRPLVATDNAIILPHSARQSVAGESVSTMI